MLRTPIARVGRVGLGQSDPALMLWANAIPGLFLKIVPALDQGTATDLAGGIPVSADAQSVQVQRDRSGCRNSTLQIGASSRPTYRTAVVNGRPVLRFDGVDDQLPRSVADLTDVLNAAPGGASARTICVVASATGVVIGAPLWYGTAAAAGNGEAFGLFLNPGAEESIGVSGHRYGAATCPSGFHLWTVIFPAGSTLSTSFRLRRDGGELTMGTITGSARTVATATARLVLGSAGGSSFFAGDVAAVFGWTRELTAAEITSVEAQINSLYALW